MRVIAGSAGGRPLVAPRGRDTRPTSDRVREALFSSLQTRVPGARLADLYAGSGALGIEALSRGASSVTFVEKARAARRAIEDNLRVTGLGEDAILIPGDVRTALLGGLPGGPFDVVLLDPPYAIETEDLAEVLRLVVDAVTSGGLIVVEGSVHRPPPRWPEDVLVGDPRRYGDTLLHTATRPDRGSP